MTSNFLVTALLLFLIFDIVFFVFILIRRKKNSLSLKDKNYIKMHWYRVLDHFETNPSKAIIDADKILDFMLIKRGYVGSLGEKLKKSGALFSDLNGIWMAHKLRNRVAHELGDLDKSEATRALNSFKKAFQDLGADL